MTKPAHILCFTDVLCGYSYIAHARFEQLVADFGDHVRLTYHFRSTYGDVHQRIAQSGRTAAEYGAMAHALARRFEHVAIHPDLFQRDLPRSSMPAHLYLRAVKILEDAGRIAGAAPFERMMWAVQLAFFRDLRDVSRREVLDDIARHLEIPTGEVAEVIDDGRAFAALDGDSKLERRFNVTASPSLVLDDGRQVLSGNVGYRVIEANIREMLSTAPLLQSWC